MKKFIGWSVALVAAGLIVAWNVQAEEHKHDEGSETTVKGEVIDMACYIDHGASGAKHAECAKTCIESGLPVGMKGEDGKTYLLIGDHKPMNKELAAYAGKTITVKGKVVSRDGINMMANAEVVMRDQSSAAIYTCPMHPEVQEPVPGKCPKCGMNLVLKK